MGDFLQEPAQPAAGPSEHVEVNRKKVKKRRGSKRFTDCHDKTCCDKENKFDTDNVNVSFAGCGFLGIYHLGVITAFQHFAPNLKFESICGASAGSIAGVALVAEIPISK